MKYPEIVVFCSVTCCRRISIVSPSVLTDSLTFYIENIRNAGYQFILKSIVQHKSLEVLPTIVVYREGDVVPSGNSH